MRLVYMSPKRAVSVKIGNGFSLIGEEAVLIGQESRKTALGWNMVIFNSDCPDGKSCWVPGVSYGAFGELR